MAGLYEKALLKSIGQADAHQRITLVSHADAGTIDAYSKVPPQHLIESRAQRQVQQWLRELDGSASNARKASSAAPPVTASKRK